MPLGLLLHQLLQQLLPPGSRFWECVMHSTQSDMKKEGAEGHILLVTACVPVADLQAYISAGDRVLHLLPLCTTSSKMGDTQSYRLLFKCCTH